MGPPCARWPANPLPLIGFSCRLPVRGGQAIRKKPVSHRNGRANRHDMIHEIAHMKGTCIAERGAVENVTNRLKKPPSEAEGTNWTIFRKRN